MQYLHQLHHDVNVVGSFDHRIKINDVWVAGAMNFIQLVTYDTTRTQFDLLLS